MVPGADPLKPRGPARWATRLVLTLLASFRSEGHLLIWMLLATGRSSSLLSFSPRIKQSSTYAHRDPRSAACQR